MPYPGVVLGTGRRLPRNTPPCGREKGLGGPPQEESSLGPSGPGRAQAVHGAAQDLQTLLGDPVSHQRHGQARGGQAGALQTEGAPAQAPHSPAAGQACHSPGPCHQLPVEPTPTASRSTTGATWDPLDHSFPVHLGACRTGCRAVDSAGTRLGPGEQPPQALVSVPPPPPGNEI